MVTRLSVVVLSVRRRCERSEGAFDLLQSVTSLPLPFPDWAGLSAPGVAITDEMCAIVCSKNTTEKVRVADQITSTVTDVRVTWNGSTLYIFNMSESGLDLRPCMEIRSYRLNYVLSVVCAESYLITIE